MLKVFLIKLVSFPLLDNYVLKNIMYICVLYIYMTHILDMCEECIKSRIYKQSYTQDVFPWAIKSYCDKRLMFLFPSSISGRYIYNIHILFSMYSLYIFFSCTYVYIFMYIYPDTSEHLIYNIYVACSTYSSYVYTPTNLCNTYDTLIYSIYIYCKCKIRFKNVNCWEKNT